MWVTVAIAGVNEDFIEAAKRGDLTAVKSLIANGVNVNVVVNSGATALMAASWQGRKRCGKMLLAKGANVNAKATDGGTAMMIASEFGHKEVVENAARQGGRRQCKKQ